MGSSMLVLVATCMLFARLPQASAYTGSAVCACNNEEDTTMLPTGGATPSVTTLAEKVAGEVVNSACADCWSIISTVLPFLFPTDKPNIWQQIKAQVQSLINDDEYEAQMHNLDEQLNSFQADLQQYSDLPEKNSFAGATQIQALLTNVQSSLCTYIEPTTLGTDAALQISNAQFVYLASFMNLHLSVMLERNKVYAAYKPNEANDESFKSLFLGTVSAYSTLMENLFQSATSYRRMQISGLSEMPHTKDKFYASMQNYCHYDWTWSDNGEDSYTTYWNFYDKFHQGIVCNVIEKAEMGSDYGESESVQCTNSQSVAQECYNEYVNGHSQNSNSFWYSLLTSPSSEWSNQAQAMSDKILNSAVSPSDFSFSSICEGLSSGPSSNASAIMV